MLATSRETADWEIRMIDWDSFGRHTISGHNLRLAVSFNRLLGNPFASSNNVLGH